MSAGLPAESERTQYGEPPLPVGPSGRICHTVKPALASQSMKARPPRPRPALSELTCSRTPARRRSSTGLDEEFMVLAIPDVLARVQQLAHTPPIIGHQVHGLGAAGRDG